MRAKDRGIDVRLIADKSRAVGPTARGPAGGGVPIWIDRDARVARAKTMVIDGALTLMVWMHWTCGAAANADRLNLLLTRQVDRSS